MFTLCKIGEDEPDFSGNCMLEFDGEIRNVSWDLRVIRCRRVCVIKKETTKILYGPFTVFIQHKRQFNRLIQINLVKHGFCRE